MRFAVFFSIVFTIYAAINYYIIYRGLMMFPEGSRWRTWVVIMVSLLALSFVAGRFLERLSVNWFTATLIWIGSFWLGIMVYLLLQILLIDIIRVFNSLIGFFPDFITRDPQQTRRIVGVVVLSLSLLIVGLGHLNTWFPKVRKLTLQLQKSGGQLDTLNIVAMSDIHLGTTIEKRHMSRIVRRVNDLHPDIILIPGDIIDEDIAPVIKSNVGEKLTSLQAKYGVYASTGNHEYIGGVRKAKAYLKDHNVNVLSDTAILIHDSFYVVGREDLTINQFTHHQRKSLAEIMADVDTTKPVILLDHQPFKLNQAAENHVDLQLSGHTHHGQLWPFNYITKMIYELSWGYLKKGNTHYYVSSGAGGWGPPIRTVNRPEILTIQLVFNQKQ
ncbi:MAG: metallophosphoesterase [bacterium]